jgi:hypothetical protein
MQPDAFVRQATVIESVYDINPGTNTMGYGRSIATTREHNGREQSCSSDSPGSVYER